MRLPAGGRHDPGGPAVWRDNVSFRFPRRAPPDRLRQSAFSRGRSRTHPDGRLERAGVGSESKCAHAPGVRSARVSAP